MPHPQLVITSRRQVENGLASLGSVEELIHRLSLFNTSPDQDGGDVLYGPGIRIELPPQDPVEQMLLTITEEEIAWHVILRLAKLFEWRIIDPATGRELNP